MTNAEIVTHLRTLVKGPQIICSVDMDTLRNRSGKPSGKPTIVDWEYLFHLQRLNPPTFEQPSSFHHGLHLTANVERVLKKPVFLWNRHA